MAGASDETMRVAFVNANWTPGEDGEDGTFALLVVTEDEERHILSPSPSSMAALVAITQASSVILWDEPNQTLIAANLVGEWLSRDWTGAGDDESVE